MDEEMKQLMLEEILTTLTGVDLQLAVMDPYVPDEDEKRARGGAAHYLVGGAILAITRELSGSDTESPYRYLARMLGDLAPDEM